MKAKKLVTLLVTLPLIAVASGCNKTKTDADAVLPENQRLFRDEEERVTLRQVVRDGEGQGNPAPTTGNTRVLVLPIEFADYPADEIAMHYTGEGGTKRYEGEDAGPGRGAENARDDIRKVFFGKSEDTAWYSLSSYYKSSSYGKLNFNGLVANWIPAFTNWDTHEQLTTKEFKDNNGTARGLCDAILNWYSNESSKKYKEFLDDKGMPMFSSGKDFLKYFDSDDDGYVDIVEMVYSAPYHAQYYDEGTGKWKAVDDDLFWAYCGGTSSDPGVNKPKMSKYAFQSYYTLFEGGYVDNTGKQKNWTTKEICDGTAKVDAHTIVHETGHGLGLPDYYNYDTQTAPAVGAVDMMALNVGDHNSVSKSLLGWTNPVVVKGPTEVTVKSFTDTGECIYIPYRGYYDDGSDIDKKNKNTFNTEYIAVELYTPTGVNVADSQTPYIGSYPLCPSVPGIKVYHPDYRLGLFDYSSGAKKFSGYTSTIVSTSSQSYVTHAHSNTTSDTLKKDNGDPIWVLEYLYKNASKKPAYITNDSLYQEGDVIFDGDHYSDFKMNSGADFGYKITVKSLSADSATLLIEAKH